jgi:hypothetical protein
MDVRLLTVRTCYLQEAVYGRYIACIIDCQAITNSILNSQYESIPSTYSDTLKTIIEMLLTKDPNKRPSIEKVISLATYRKLVFAYIGRRNTIASTI